MDFVDRLARIETKLDALMERSQEDREFVRKELETIETDFDSRVSSLERWRTGIVMVGTFIVVVILPLVLAFIP